ncbi:MAG: uncharacterized protein JWM16_800 [Verrucomicrobiales bacterium]|nr:uncharacterized protein [Verrucomicrobiales bacterium]
MEEQGRTMVSLDGMALSDVVKRLRGEPGSVVTLLVVPAGQPAANPVPVKLTRESLLLLEREAKGQLLTNPPMARKVSSMPVQRTFPLRHKLGSDLVEELRRVVVAERSGYSANYSDDNQSITIIAPPDVLTRAQTFITVTDWPDPLRSLNGPTYLTDTVLRTARSVFHACAVEASAETLSSLLSLRVLAELRGGEKTAEYQNYMMGGIPDPAWEKALRGDWPGKREALQRFVQEWNRYPLKRLTEEAGLALGFGVKHFCSVSFEGAPEEFYRITIEPDRTERGTSHDTFFFSELPPWSKPRELATNTANANAALLSLPYQQFDQTPHSGWRALAQDGGLFHEAAALIEAYLSHDGLGTDQRVNLHFHAAQCLAFAGDAKSVLDALGHLKQARYSPEPPDVPLRWNDYVEATEAFLKGDLDALKAARERIAAGPRLNGTPANLDVVDRLIARFGQPYRDAYRS